MASTRRRDGSGPPRHPGRGRAAGRPDQVRPGTNGLPPPGPRRECHRRLGVGAAGWRRRRPPDRGSRPDPVATSFEAALLEDLAWLGFEADEPAAADGPTRPAYRQSERDDRYRRVLEDLLATGLVYGCRCSRATFARWRDEHGRDWRGTGCPGGCRARDLPLEPRTPLRVVLGTGQEAYRDLLHGPDSGEPAASGDVLVRDRDGNWTYHFAVVVDDLDQAIDLVVRGNDLLAATPLQLRLRRLLGGDPSRLLFLHHPLVRAADGRKLSKSAGDTGVRDLRGAGWSAEAVLGMAAAAIGLLDAPQPIRLEDLLEG